MAFTITMAQQSDSRGRPFHPCVRSPLVFTFHLALTFRRADRFLVQATDAVCCIRQSRRDAPLTSGRHTQSGKLRVSRYHGHKRAHDFNDLINHDVVITTYGTIAKEFSKPSRKVLYHMCFFRIVLDEGKSYHGRNG